MIENEISTPPGEPRPEPAGSETLASATSWEGYSLEILDAILDP
jgi:hypothetical protein